MEKLYTFSKTRLGANCGSDHELLIAKFRLKLKKVKAHREPGCAPSQGRQMNTFPAASPGGA